MTHHSPFFRIPSPTKDKFAWIQVRGELYPIYYFQIGRAAWRTVVRTPAPAVRCVRRGWWNVHIFGKLAEINAFLAFFAVW